MLKIALCDDSRTDMERLEMAFDRLRQYPFNYDVYFSAEELLKNRKKQEEDYQLYIFDIELPGISGLELARELRKDDEKALFVFLTSCSEYVMEVFDVITFDYILKPITEEKLEKVLLKAMRYLEITKQDFVFQFRKDHFRIKCEDILYFEKNGRQAVIHAVNGEYRTNMTIMDLWKQLDDKVFSHIHLSYIVNLCHIRAIEGDEVVLDNGEHLLITRSHKQELKEKHRVFSERTK